MAEILGLIASVAAVIQLTDAVDKKVSEHIHTVKGVQSVLVPLLGRLRHLHTIVSALQLELETTKSSVLQYLYDPLRICETLLTKLKSRLDHLKIVAGCVIGPVLDKDSLKHLRQLDDLTPVLQLALDADTLTSIHALEDYLQSLRLESVERVQLLRHDIQAYHNDARKWMKGEDQQREITAESQLKEKVLSWLCLVNPEANYLTACQQNQPGTGSWLLESKDFSDWERGRYKCLWLNALAGAGKTILSVSSTVIRHLIAKHDDTCVVYYFFDFKDTAKQDVKNLLASLLTQAVETFKSLPKPLLELFQRHRLRNPERPTPPTTDDLLGVLISVLDLRSTTFIVVDALDECNEIGLLLETLCAILYHSRSDCRFFFTSRPENEIQRSLQEQDIKDLPIQSTDVDRDVAVYIQAVLETDDRLRAHRQGIKELITNSLVGGAKGMFRWVQCQVDHIRTLRTASEVKRALRGLPPNLDQTYDRILISIRPEDRELLYKALQLMVFSARPLNVREVAEAVIVKPGTSEIDEDDRLQNAEDLLDIGKSLFIQSSTTQRTQLLELSHYSVKEYLLSERIKRGPAAAFAIDEIHAELNNATCLLTYLGLEVFEDNRYEFARDISKPADEMSLKLEAEHLAQEHEQRLVEYPLLSYAAQNCFRHHCRTADVQRGVSTLICSVFSPPHNGRFQNMTYTCVYMPLDPVASYERLFRYSLISIAARYNLSIVVQDLLMAKIPADYLPPKPDWIKPYPEGQAALYRAADFGHTDLCKILIDAGANVQGIVNYDCPLSAASRGGKPEILQLMLDAGADVVKDARPLAEAQLAIWWRYVEEKNNCKWRNVLDILRDAGAKWSTVGLLSAFSKCARPLVKHAAEDLQDNTLSDTREQSDNFGSMIDRMDTSTLNALQWLAQDEAGTAGLKATLETKLRATYKSLPYLFASDARFTTWKYTAEEVIAENLIHEYFRPTPNLPSESAPRAVAERSEALLNALWDNKPQITKEAKPTAGIPSAAIPSGSSEEGMLDSGGDGSREVEKLIVCGDILQAWTRARWEDSYAYFFD